MENIECEKKQAQEFLAQGLSLLKIENPEAQKKLLIFLQAILEANQKFNLTSENDSKKIVICHILDSLSAVPILKKYFCKENFFVADIGSGAGFPGIPLAVAFPNVRWTLVERMKKRSDFLAECVFRMKLQNVKIQNEQAERLSQNQFDALVFRAFHPLDKKLVKILFRILKSDSKIFAYKAKREKIEEEIKILPQKNFAKIFPLYVPFLTENPQDGEEVRERNLLVIENVNLENAKN